MAKQKPVWKNKEDRRLGVLAQEMALSATQTLKDEFGFTPEQLDAFLKKWLERAAKNRQGGKSG